VNKLADVGKAENQPVSAKILKTAEAMSGVITEAYTMQELNEEIARLQHTINEQAKQIDPLEHRLGNQAVTIKTQAETIGRMETEQAQTLEMLKDGNSAHVLILKGDVFVTRRQLAHLLGDAYQELFATLEEKPPQNPPICPIEPPLAQNGENVPAEPENATDSPNIATDSPVLDLVDSPVPVHTSPQVRLRGGE
jgi:hypothetical protein